MSNPKLPAAPLSPAEHLRKVVGLPYLSVIAAAECAARMEAQEVEVASADITTITLASDDSPDLLIAALPDDVEVEPPDAADPADYNPPRPGPGVVPAHVLALALKAHALYPVVPISVTIAQWAKESGWSLHLPPNSNNPFGIKCYDPDKGCSSAKTPEQDAKGKQSIVSQRFQAFTTFDDAFTNHARILATSRHYADARNSSDIDGFVKGLSAYATDIDYTASLIRDYLRPYDLYKYDQCESAATHW